MSFKTGLKVEKEFSNSPKVKVLFNKKNLGVGATCKSNKLFARK